MFSVAFDDVREIRMASPYNIAKVRLDGFFRPNLAGYAFQDLALISQDGDTCYLVEWFYPDMTPGFCVWKIDAVKKSVERSGRILGQCDGIEFCPQGVKVLVSRSGQKWEPIQKVEVVVGFVAEISSVAI